MKQAVEQQREIARARVAAGATLLDEEYPGWAQRVNLGQLNLRNQCSCVLGQLSGSDYFAGLRQLGLGPLEGQQLGFNADQIEATYTTYEDIQVAWVEEIGKRR